MFGMRHQIKQIHTKLAIYLYVLVLRTLNHMNKMCNFCPFFNFMKVFNLTSCGSLFLLQLKLFFRFSQILILLPIGCTCGNCFLPAELTLCLFSQPKLPRLPRKPRRRSDQWGTLFYMLYRRMKCVYRPM